LQDRFPLMIMSGFWGSLRTRVARLALECSYTARMLRVRGFLIERNPLLIIADHLVSWYT
jgi:hypothetical protein